MCGERVGDSKSESPICDSCLNSLSKYIVQLGDLAEDAYYLAALALIVFDDPDQAGKYVPLFIQILTGNEYLRHAVTSLAQQILVTGNGKPN